MSVFVHVVLQLVDQGRPSLDTPLAHHPPGYIRIDERAATVTAAHALSHSSGLPNWRTDNLPLKTHFAPGRRFSYSGEGFLYLQKAVEAITLRVEAGRMGRRWATGHGRRNHAETTMGRYKHLIGPRLRARTLIAR